MYCHKIASKSIVSTVYTAPRPIPHHQFTRSTTVGRVIAVFMMLISFSAAAAASYMNQIVVNGEWYGKPGNRQNPPRHVRGYPSPLQQGS